MEVSRQDDRRANQKQRTFKAIVDAAVELMRQGKALTVQSAAEAAMVSRATAYRYFPTQESLMQEVMSIAPNTDAADEQLQQLTSEPPETQVLAILDLFNPVCIEEEAPFRAVIRLHHDLWLQSHANGETLPMRAGRRMAWLERATEQMEGTLPADQLQRLRNALALTIGIDSVAIMRDVCGIESDEELLSTLRWAAEAMLKAATEET